MDTLAMVPVYPVKPNEAKVKAEADNDATADASVAEALGHVPATEGVESAAAGELVLDSNTISASSESSASTSSNNGSQQAAETGVDPQGREDAALVYC